MTPNDWRIVGGIVIVLVVATCSKYVLGWSTKDFFQTIMHEFRDLMTAQHSAGGINAAILIAIFVMAASYLLFPKIEKILSLSGAIPTSGASEPSMLGAMLVMMIGGLVCVNFVRPK